MTYFKAFTLIQLIITLSLLILTLIVAVPSGYDFIERSRAQAVVNQLLATLSYVRYEAITRNKIIIWCGSVDKKHCGKDWSKGQIIFSGNQLLRVIDPISGNAKLSWHGFDSTDYIKVTPYPLGMTMDGRFSYFPANNDPNYAREVVINRLGRGRVGKQAVKIT